VTPWSSVLVPICTTATPPRSSRRAVTATFSRRRQYSGNERRALQELIVSTVRRGDASSVIRRVESSPIQVSKQLADALESMLRGNEEFVLIDDQKTAYESIREAIRTVPDRGKAVVLVKGGPAPGSRSLRSMPSSTYLLKRERSLRNQERGSSRCLSAKLKGKRLDVATNNLFVSSDAFHDVSKDAFDVLWSTRLTD